jgi:hypothetical protein
LVFIECLLSDVWTRGGHLFFHRNGAFTAAPEPAIVRRVAMRGRRERRAPMANEVQTRTGNCPTHGQVEATREVPRPGFPYVVYFIRRMLAQRRPYRCPDCGAAVTTA